MASHDDDHEPSHHPATKPTVEVAVVSDLACPWCYVAARQLEAAIEAVRPEMDVTIAWEPFFLRPQTPADGVAKGPPETRVPAHLKAAGAACGADFTGRCDRTPNTELFHGVACHLGDLERQGLIEQGAATRFHMAAFRAYFTDGAYPDADGLLDVARHAAVEDAVQALYANAILLDARRSLAKREAMRQVSARDVTAIPACFFDGRLRFDGAPREMGAFVDVLRTAAAGEGPGGWQQQLPVISSASSSGGATSSSYYSTSSGSSSEASPCGEAPRSSSPSVPRE